MLLPDLAQWLAASLLVGLRIAPVFTFAPPFSLVRLPARFRMMFGLGLAGSIAAAYPEAMRLVDLSLGTLIVAGARELMLGILFALAFQLTFAALYFAGRTVDLQAGLGIAALIDPTTRSQLPLVGMLFAYVAGALFFAMDGHLELLRIFAASLEAVPLGRWQMEGAFDSLGPFIAAIFFAAFGVAGVAIGALFAIDLAITLLSRTVPQMNALVLGFQVKTIALLLILPVCFGVGGAVLVRMVRMTLELLPRLVG